MRHMAFNDSEILREFGRLMTEKDGLTKVAQVVVPLSEEEKGKLQHFLGELQTMPSNGPGMKKWMDRLKGQQDMWLGAVHKALADRYALWSQGKDAQEISSVLLPSPTDMNMAQTPPAQEPMAAQPPMPKGAEVVEAHEKTADMKAYDVTPKEDLVETAHPETAMVSGDVVENLNEQHEADEEVAEKQPKGAKEVLIALYKLAKKLQAEQNDEAYKLVTATFKEVAGSLKK